MLVILTFLFCSVSILGPLCYKYKGNLLNCFMNGCRSPLDELRCSAFSNLAQLCRILTFQVHSFFYEVNKIQIF